MNKLIFFIFLVLLSSNCLAQSGWVVQMGGAQFTTQVFTDISFPDNSNGYLLGKNWIKKTTNSGSSWQDISFQSTLSLSSIFFIDHNTGWITGSRTFRTTNRGNSWELLDSSFSGNSIWFQNSETGWIGAAAGKLYKTINGGINWDTLNTGIVDGINDVYFTSSLNGYCAADWGVIIRTTNGGLNWIKHTDPSLSFYTDVEFINDLTGFTCGSNGTIVKTTNSGVNWINNGSGTYSNFSSVKFTSNSTGYAFGSLGTILRTTNSGSSWLPLSGTGVYGSIFGASKTQSGDFWIVSDSGMVYRSTAGNTWELLLKQMKTREHFYAVHFLNQLTGWVCGANNSLFKTTNGGTEWVQKESGTTPGISLRQMFFLNENTGFLCGGKSIPPVQGVVNRTNNGGANWTTILADTFIVYSVYFLDVNTGWAGGSSGLIRRTTNGGLTWIAVSLPVSGIVNSIKFHNSTTGVVSANSTYYTTNGGNNWQQVIISVNGHKMSFVDNNTGFVKLGNTSPTVFKTTNGGANWSGSGNLPGTYIGIFFYSSDAGWLCGTNVRHTSNGGVNWQIQPVPLSMQLNSIHFVNYNEGWAAGNDGIIIHTGSAGIGITPISNEIPREFMLKQNYPNPFNPVTKIRFQIPPRNARDRSLLKIYDALGREIETLVNEELNPGTYEIEWNAAKYSSGVYFYSLSNGSSTQTRKMVVIK